MTLLEDDRGGITVLVDGQPQSYVDPRDPGLLVFEYVEHLALGLDLLPPGRLAITHVGGAGLTLPRWVEHRRPGSPQIVLEPDASLTAAVRAALPLPRGHRIRVRPQDGLTGIQGLADASADAVVLDAFAAGAIPGDLTGERFVAQVSRVLRPGGLFLANLADEPGLRWVERVVATVRTHLPHVVALLPQEVAKGRRYGNVVVLAADTPLDEHRVRRAAAGAALPTAVLDAATWVTRLRTVVPFGPDGGPSPPAPDPGAWRVR